MKLRMNICHDCGHEMSLKDTISMQRSLTDGQLYGIGKMPASHQNGGFVDLGISCAIKYIKKPQPAVTQPQMRLF